MIGVLKSLARIWPLAQRGLTQVRTYAKEVLQRPVDMAAAPLPIEETLDTSMDDEANGTNGDFAPIDISWMDDLLQQPMQMGPIQPAGSTVPVSYDSFLNL